MSKLLPKITLILFFFLNTVIYSQSTVSHEFGFAFGVASFQTDFGESGDFPSANQSSFAYGVSHYLKFFGSQYSWRSGGGYFSSHFKLKTEFNYSNNTSIKHEGKFVENNLKLKAMTGEIRMYNLGTNLEFYFMELEDYASFYGNENILNPFLSVGLHFTAYDPDILVNDISLDGQQEPFTDLIDKWQENSIFLDPSNTFGVSAGAGLRLGLEAVDLVLESRWQHFFSDDIDGLNALNDSGNKKNDTMIMVNIGIIYVLGK